MEKYYYDVAGKTKQEILMNLYVYVKQEHQEILG